MSLICRNMALRFFKIINFVQKFLSFLMFASSNCFKFRSAVNTRRASHEKCSLFSSFKLHKLARIVTFEKYSEKKLGLKISKFGS